MSAAEVRKVSGNIHMVQIRIERCLLHYMNKKEVIDALAMQDGIDPSVTELVWQRLEQENQDFFKAYHLKLLVKDQILEFNRLLSEQVELMHRIGLTGIAPVHPSNGSHVSPTQHISASCAAQSVRPMKPENLLHPNNFNNCGPSIQSCMQGPVDGSVHYRKVDVSPSLFLSQNPNMGMAQTINGNVVKTEAGYATGSSPFNFTPPGNFLEPRSLVGDASIPTFSNVDSSAQHIHDALLDGDDSSFGFLAPLPQSLNISELATDFTNTDLLENYCRPPYIATDGNNFLDPHAEVERLDPASENLRYQCFGGD